MPKLIRLALFPALLLLCAATASAQCSFSITPNTATFPPSGGNGQVTITASSGSCTRTATSNVSWITISFGQTGTGNGTAGYTVLANNTSSTRTGTLNIAGQIFTVTQQPGAEPAPCTFSIQGGIPSFPGTGGTANLTVTASSSSCERTTTSEVSWVTITSGATGTGSGTVGISVSANTSSLSRQGSIRIGTTVFPVFQAGNNCQILVNPASITAPQTGSSGTLAIQTSTGCPWSASASVPWIQITSTASGAGSGTVTYVVAQNLDPETRAGEINISGTRIGVSQPGLGCRVDLASGGTSLPAEGGTGSVEVSSPPSCSWRAQTADNWIRITEGASGTGAGTVGFAVQPNNTVQIRTGFITVGTAIYRVTQAAGQCRVSIGATGTSVPASGGSGVVPVRRTASGARPSVRSGSSSPRLPPEPRTQLSPGPRLPIRARRTAAPPSPSTDRRSPSPRPDSAAALLSPRWRLRCRHGAEQPPST